MNKYVLLVKLKLGVKNAEVDEFASRFDDRGPQKLNMPLSMSRFDLNQT
jgi:hypothetical protein